jgi:hypothetical protein
MMKATMDAIAAGIRGILHDFSGEIRLIFRGTFSLHYILTPGTKNDAMHERKQVVALGFRKLQFESQNELDDRQVEGDHGIGTSPLSGNCGLATNNFFVKGGCPLYV